MNSKQELGKTGEALAVSHLQRKGYTILERNWRHGKAEVDIIATKCEILVVIEVKTRSSDHLKLPQEAVDRRKQRLLVDAIDHYVRNRNIPFEVRFDIIAIVKERGKLVLEHLEDAFYHF